jgi:hypothetical protein
MNEFEKLRLLALAEVTDKLAMPGPISTIPDALSEFSTGLRLAKALQPYLNSGCGLPEAQGTVYTLIGKKGGTVVCGDVRYSLPSAEHLRHEWWAGGIEVVEILKEVSREW